MTNLLDKMSEIADERGMPAPDGLTYGFRAVHPDFTSRDGFRWSFPGTWTEAPGPFTDSPNNGCPRHRGDGICIANTWEGMASGSIPATTILLVGYHAGDLLGQESSGSKIRVRRAYVRDAISASALLKGHGSGADLSNANLYSADLDSANLSNANLPDANLSNANLCGANLSSANLYGANLCGANLRSANLSSANLYGANLYGANLPDANLSNANLRYANLSNANLSNANLRYANLRDANLYGANLSNANLSDANLSDVQHSDYTVWPDGFTPPQSA